MKQAFKDEDKIRILQIGMHDKIGGVETYLMNYYRNIDHSKFQFDFISIYHKLCFEDEILELGGKVYHLPSEKKRPIRYFNELVKIMKNYRIVHINMLSAANILPIVAAKHAKVKYIIVHSHNSNTPSGILRKILDRLNRTYLRKNATDFWACSILAGKWLFGEKIVKTEKFKIIPNAVDTTKFKFDIDLRNKIRKELKIESKFVIGHIGRFSYQKNHEFLINMFYEFQKHKPNAVLILIGDGELKEKIKEQVKSLAISDKVIFVGTTDKVEKYLNAMDVFVLPSRFEGLPVVGIEAQMTGIPCIFSNSVTSEVNISNNSKFINLDIEKWCDTLQNVKNRNNKFKCQEYDIKFATMKIMKYYSECNKIKIIHCLYGVGRGGVEKVLYSYLANSSNIINTIVTQEILDKEICNEFKNAGFDLFEIGKKSDGILKYCRKFNYILKMKRPDIVHSHMTLGNFLPMYLAWKKHIKIRISHSHFAFEKDNLKTKVQKFLGNMFANYYVACSEDAAKFLFGKKYRKAFILNNAIDLNKYCFRKDVREKVRKNLNVEKKFVIGNVGRFTEQKNHKFIIELFDKIYKKYPNVILLLIGDGELKETIRNDILNRNIEENCIILKNRDDVNELLMGMDLFIFPSLFEGLGIAVVEAQATGLPCICSTSMPSDVRILDDCEMIPLIEKEKWLNSCEKHLKDTELKDRTYAINEIKNTKFDLKKEREKLKEYYYSLLKENG